MAPNKPEQPAPVKRFVPLTGSERSPMPGARRKGAADPDELMRVTLLLQPPHPDEQAAAIRDIVRTPAPLRRHLTREQFAEKHGAPSADIDRIRAFAREFNLAPSRINPAERTIELSGSVRDMSRAFLAQLDLYETPDGRTFRGRTGPLHLPEPLLPIVSGVFGFDQRPAARPHFRRRPQPSGPALPGYSPRQVAELYGLPPGLNGSGQTIGIIELGGGFRSSDLSAFFKPLGPAPSIATVSVDGASNQPTGEPDGPDAEVCLDIEVAGSVAPKAGIVVYFAPNSGNKGFIDAVATAIHDTTHRPSILSISWGSPEDSGDYTAMALRSFSQLFQDAAMLGISVLVASGDQGSSDGLPSGSHVDFPASDPLVTACGGTQIESSGPNITSERVWNDQPAGGATGGGISTVFPPPDYQRGLQVPLTAGTLESPKGRSVPDIAANAAPSSGYAVIVDGQPAVIGGTSAVAPLIAGFVALANQQMGKPVGFLNPLLYGIPPSTPAFRDITQGNNGSFAAGPGYDATTGRGTPVGPALIAELLREKTGAAAV